MKLSKGYNGDRSDKNLVFKVLEQCGSHVACVCVFGNTYSCISSNIRVGKKHTLETTEVEITIVTEAFLAALGTG